MKKHIVIGASGLIGGALLDLLKKESLYSLGTYTSKQEPNLHYFDLTKGDYSIFNDINEGDTFYLLSAYSNPNWIAKNKDQAEDLNYKKTIKFIDFLISKKAKILFMSSVEIFDGTKGDYKEDDYPNPLNYYGELKLKVENYLATQYNDFTIARTGWNVGLNEKSRCVVQLTYETLLNPGAKMAIDNFFSLSSVQDTAEGLYRAANQENLKKIHICSEKKVNRAEMAILVILHSEKGKKMNFDDCLFKDIPYSEPRGRVNDLNNSLSKELLNMNYIDADKLIIDKVKYIDANERQD
jgi:dTDP-4-dehydrorhamnose reductase